MKTQFPFVRVFSSLFFVLVLSGFVCFSLFSGFSSAGTKKTDVNSGWVGTWSTAPQLVEPNNMPPAPGLTNNTLRQVVCVSIGGKKLRFRFSNEFSKSPVAMKSVEIAVSKGGSDIDPKSVKKLTFGGKSEVVMAPGVAISSDAVNFDLKPRMEVAITIAFGETSPDVTGHPGSRTTSYLLAGTQLANADFSRAVKTDHWYVINGIDVYAPKAAAIAIIGNSITDGRGSGTNKQNRWSDILAQRLINNPDTKHIGVLNMGIGGNCVLRGGLGPTALSRFDRDILKQSGVRWVVILEGVNDIGGTRNKAMASRVARELTEAYSTMIDAAHAKGLKVYGATITPINKSSYGGDFREAARDSVNNWIRNSGRFDGIIDFDKAVRDPNDVITLLQEAQTGDFLHPNEKGYEIMGNAIDLGLFK